MFSEFVLATSMFYVVALVCGMTLFILGYRLFRLGIFGSQLAMDGALTSPAPGAGGAPSGTGGLSPIQFRLMNVAPGTAFAIMGSVLVGIALLNGPDAISEARKSAKEIAEQKAKFDAEGKKAEADRARSEAAVAQASALKSPSFPPFAPSTSAGDGANHALIPSELARRSIMATGGASPTTHTPTIGEEQQRLKELQPLADAFGKLAEQKPLNKDEQQALKRWLLSHPVPKYSPPLPSSGSSVAQAR